MAQIFDSNHDGLLTVSDLKEMFAPLEENRPPWETCNSIFLTPEILDTNSSTEMSYQTFLGLWSFLLHIDPRFTLYSLLQLGIWQDYHSLLRWVSSNQADRCIVHCCIVGKNGVGKSSLLQYLRSGTTEVGGIGAPIQTILCPVKSDPEMDPKTWNYVIVTEVNEGSSDGMWQCINQSDLCVFLFNVTSPESFQFCNDIQSQMHDQAVLYIGTHKDELVTSFDMTDLHTTVETYCTQFALKYPSLISLKGNYPLDRQELFRCSLQLL